MLLYLRSIILCVLTCIACHLNAQIFSESFGTTFSTTALSASNWSTCRSTSSNTSVGGCSATGDYSVSISNAQYLVTRSITIPASGYCLSFAYAFNATSGFPKVQVGTGGALCSSGTIVWTDLGTLTQSATCTNTSFSLTPWAGQTVWIRFLAGSSFTSWYLDDITIHNAGCSSAPTGRVRWADNFNDNDLLLDYPGTSGNETCPTCGPWVLGTGASLNLVPSAGWNGNTNETEAFPDNMSNVYYVRLDRNEHIESPVMDISNLSSFKISFYAKSSSSGTGGGDTWSFSDRLRLQIWTGSAWTTVQSLRDDLSATWSGSDDYVSSALPFKYYCFTAYKNTNSPGNYYYNTTPNVNAAYFHSGFKFRVIFEGGSTGAPFAWVDDFTFRADADGYSTMIPCGLSFWNEPAATSYGRDLGSSGNPNAEKGVELELGNSINIPPLWATQANDGDQVTQAFGSGESERVVFCVLSEQRIQFAFPVVHFYAPSMGWQSSVMSVDNNYTGPGWRYYAVEYISCDLAGGSIAEPTEQFRYYYSFEYGNEFIPVFYHLNTSGIEVGGGATSTLETFDAPDVLSIDNCGLLPVTWAWFKGEWSGTDALLNWQTQTETGNVGFWVERSLDGENYSPVGEVLASGAGTAYQFLDQGVKGLASRLYYRIRQLDGNGGSSLSETIVLHDAPGLDFQLLGNPSQTLTLQLQNSHHQDLSLRITDLLGRTHKALSLGTEGGMLALGEMDLAAGTYLVTLCGQGDCQSKRWTKE